MNFSSLPKNWKIKHTQLLCDSYFHFFKTPLLPILTPRFEDLFEAPFILLSHGTEPDPILNFGNQMALKLWEFSWDELTKMPSRLTAEPLQQSARTQFMQQVKANGFVDDYSGIRINQSGRRFKIENAKVWNLIDDQQQLQGQAACFSTWSYLL